jgi:DNA-binding YbaB/EbfC family protein
MFKELGNLASMMRQAQQIGGKMEEITAQLKSRRVTGTAGGGMIEVESNGLGEVLKIRIEPSLTDREMIEDMLPAAINQASTKSKQLHMEMMQSLTGGVDLPGLNDMMSQLGGGDPPPTP